MTASNKSKSLTFNDRWPPNVAAAGFTPVPNYLIIHQSELGLTKSELVILIQLMSFDFGDHLVWPSHSTLAKRMGSKSSSLRQNLVSLENKGFIKRNFRKGETNQYSLIPAIYKLNNHYKSNPANKMTGLQQKTGRDPPQKNDTKEDPLIRIKDTEGINEILKRRNYYEQR